MQSSFADYTVLGIEGTAHTLGIGIVRGEEILADQRKMFIPVTGGIHPRESARMMNEAYPSVLTTALTEAQLNYRDIDAISFSQGPGLGPCLRTCATGARTLALTLKKPLIGVNHPLAHIELGRKITHVADPLTCYVSGGNTQLIVYSYKRYRVMGETQDIALGNLLDQFGRELGFPHPGGPKVEQCALKANKAKLIELPYAIKGMDISYSGLFSSIVDRYHEMSATINENYTKEDLCADLCHSLQEYAFAMICEVLERALVVTAKKDVLITGGVAINQRLREMISIVAQEHQAVLHSMVPAKMAADNGVMIAWTGLLYLRNDKTTPISLSYINPRHRIEEVEVYWR